MVNRYVMKSEHDLFIDCLPYEWRSGTSDGLFLPIYPPRSMRVVLGFWWLVDFCNKYVSSLWLMLSPWIIRTLTFLQFASLYGTVHCPFSPWELVQTSPVHPNPVIWYALSHINLLISSSKQPPYLPIMAFPWPFRDILPCNFPPFRLSCHVHHCHIALHDHVVDIVFVAKPPCILLHTCHSWFIAHPGTPPEAFI